MPHEAARSGMDGRNDSAGEATKKLRQQQAMRLMRLIVRTFEEQIEAAEQQQSADSAK